MHNNPHRLKRAISQPAGKAQGTQISVVSVGGAPRAQSRVLPDAEVAHAPRKADPLAGVALGSALGVRKAAPSSVIKFPRQPVTDLRAGALGVTRKAAPVVVAYVRHDAPHDAAFIQRFADNQAHELRREAKTGRGILRGIVSGLAKGDVLLLEKLTDLATPRDLPKAIQEIEGRGIQLRSLDGASSSTPDGRAKIAKAVLASKQLFPGLRL